VLPWRGVLAGGLVAATSCGWCVPEPVDAGTHYAQRVFDAQLASGAVPGVINVFYRDGVQETACLGYADVATGRRITLDDPFMQCSQTKGFCGVTVAILVEEGKLSLDDPVSKYLPEFETLWVLDSETNGERRVVRAANVLTVRHVMSHMGGLPFELPNYERMGGWNRRMPLRSAAAVAAALPLEFEPGTRDSYSNLGIDIGAAVVEVVAGMRWERFLKIRVLDPLGMTASTFLPTDAQLAAKIESYWSAPDKTAVLLPEHGQMAQPYNDDRVFASAGAGLWTTARDQLRFYKMLMNLGVGDNGVRILKEETVKSILARSVRPAGKGGYSLGLDAPENDGDDAWFGHGGAWGSCCFVNWHRKELRLHVVQCGGWTRELSEKAAKDFFRHAFDDPSAAPTGLSEPKRAQSSAGETSGASHTSGDTSEQARRHTAVGRK